MVGNLLLCNFVSLGAFLALNYFKTDLIALSDGDIGHEAGCMNKIILSVVACNESKSLGSVKEFYCSSYHSDSSVL